MSGPGAPPALSVLLPFRDAAPTLAEAVESVLAERDPHLELLAIDDGSRDEGPRWVEAPGEPASWSGVEDIPSEELWRTHERRRERLVAFARRRLRRQLVRRGS